MSFPDYPPSPPFTNGDFWHEKAIDDDDVDSNPHLDHSQALKRPRNSLSNSPPLNPPNFPRANPSNPLVNRGTGHIFYKTRMCLKFLDGNCRNGDSCTFAHGAEELREPPPNWQEIVGRKENGNGYDDQRSVHRFKICKKYANGEECPYGESCNFLHKRGTASFDAEVDPPRESSVILIGTNAPPMGIRSGPDQIDVLNNIDNKHVNPSSDAFRVNMKPAYWKTKLCSRWEVTGYCPFGEKCHFAHGHADLQLPGVRSEAEAAHFLSSFSVTKPLFAPTTAATDIGAALVAPTTDSGVKKLCEKWKGPKKINGIYGDWLDGLEPPPMYPKNAED